MFTQSLVCQRKELTGLVKGSEEVLTFDRVINWFFINTQNSMQSVVFKKCCDMFKVILVAQLGNLTAKVNNT